MSTKIWKFTPKGHPAKNHLCVIVQTLLYYKRLFFNSF